MKELGGSVFRTTKSTAIREHRTQPTKKFKAEVDALMGELAQGHDNIKEKTTNHHRASPEPPDTEDHRGRGLALLTLSEGVA